MKHLMSGNEATARGVYEAGIKVCSAYPGTPSTEILENLPQYGKDVYCEWAPNEKVATEVAYGASVAGSRAFCTMKMVGLNVAADPLFTAGYMGVNGAYVVVTADDPSCHSSQNEQDNRHYARAAKIAMVEPSDAQECKDFVRLACEISEEFDTPVLYRTTTRVCHSKGLVEFGDRVEHTAPAYARNTRKYVCAPANAYLNHPIVEERLVKLAEYGCTRALENGLNKVELGDGKVGVITASISYQYAKEVFPEGTSFLKLGLTYPLPMDLIRDFAGKVEKLYVIEELDPFMEDEIKAAGIACTGKELTGKLYELNTELVRERVLGIKPNYKTITDVQVAKRPPALCPGKKFRFCFLSQHIFLKFRSHGRNSFYGIGTQWSCLQLIIFQILPDHFNAIQIKILILDHIQSCRTHFCQLSVIFTGLISGHILKELQSCFFMIRIFIQYILPGCDIGHLLVKFRKWCHMDLIFSIHACILKSTQHTGIHKHTSILAVYKFFIQLVMLVDQILL